MPHTAYRVLLVEDNPSEAQLVTDLIGRAGARRFEVAYAPTLERARDMAADTRFDCIVLDLQLHGTEGASPLSEMRKASPGTPVVALTDHDTDLRSALQGGEGVEFINTSASRSALDRRILSALERYRSIKLHRQFEGLVVANPDAMIVTDFAGYVRYANRAACQLFGRGERDFLGEKLHFALPDTDVAHIEFQREGETRAGEIRLVYCSWDEEPAMLSVIRDITEQKAMAERLRLAQRMEAIGKFAGGTAHDFGNILSCIGLFADIAKRDLKSDDPQIDNWNRVLRAVDSGRSLVRQMVALARSKSAEPQIVDLGAVILELQDFLRRALPASIALFVDCPDEHWSAAIDPGQVEQVLLNLAINARDAMPKGGVLRIRVRNVVLSRAEQKLPPGDYVAVDVSDTGEGISPEHLGRVFEPFFSTKSADEGSGLGLAMCQSIIALAGGDVSVSSIVGEGATFTMLLPRAATHDGEAAQNLIPGLMAIR